MMVWWTCRYLIICPIKLCRYNPHIISFIKHVFITFISWKCLLNHDSKVSAAALRLLLGQFKMNRENREKYSRFFPTCLSSDFSPVKLVNRKAQIKRAEKNKVNDYEHHYLMSSASEMIMMMMMIIIKWGISAFKKPEGFHFIPRMYLFLTLLKE